MNDRIIYKLGKILMNGKGMYLKYEKFSQTYTKYKNINQIYMASIIYMEIYKGQERCTYILQK